MSPCSHLRRKRLGVRSCNITLLSRAGADGAVSAGRLGRLKYRLIRGRMILPLEFFPLLL
jgi:hypothetical protein